VANRSSARSLASRPMYTQSAAAVAKCSVTYQSPTGGVGIGLTARGRSARLFQLWAGKVGSGGWRSSSACGMTQKPLARSFISATSCSTIPVS
jgi:hypothetical protein